MGEKIVVLGGAGLIGTHLCLQLLNQGEDIVCIDIRDADDSPMLHSALSHSNFRYVKHNIINSFEIECDQIYNLTAPTRLRYDHTLPIEVLKLNVLGAINTTEAASRNHARILYASSGDIYGLPYRESFSDNSAQISPRHIMAEGKRAAEAFHRAYHAEHGVDSRIARIFNTYGSGTATEDQHVVTKMIVAALRNRDITIYGSGEQTRTFCWVGDMVDGLIMYMNHPQEGLTRTINMGGKHEISILMLAEKIAKMVGSRSKITHLEARMDDPRHLRINLETAKCELAWGPSTTLTEGLQRTINYLEHELSHKSWTEMSWVEING